MEILQNMRPSFAFIQAFLCAVVISGTASRAAGQVGTGETVVQKATEQFESSPLKATSLDKGIWMFSGDGRNVTAIAAEGNTLLIDSGVDSRVSELSDAIFKATRRPITRLVNTHNVPFIGLRDGRYPTQALPTVTYSISMTLCQDGQHLTSVNYGPAHTDGDTIIYISPANVAVVGDIFSNHLYPIIDLASGGSIDGMIHSLDQILAQTDEQTKIVPGHGPVATRSDLKDYRDMLVQVRQHIKVLIAEGKTIDEAVAAAPTKDFDAKWGDGYVPPDVFTRMVFTSLIDSRDANR